MSLNQNPGFIFARGGSKGLRGKNIAELAGKPLIAWAIEQALECSFIDEVIVSTDSEQIAEIASSFGARVPYIRPAELALDSTPEILAWKHALREYEREYGYLPKKFVTLPTTSPLRLTADIEKANVLFDGGGFDGLVAITRTDKNPWFNLVQIDDNRCVRVVIRPRKKIFRRQDAPEVFTISTSVFFANVDWLLGVDSFYAGRIFGYEIDPKTAIDIDSDIDLKICEQILRDRAE